MSLWKTATNLPPYRDNSGKVYKIIRTVVSKPKTDNLANDPIWETIDTTYSLDDGTSLTTDDDEDTFALNTKPSKILHRVTPRV